jgi:hypothetical protein
MCVAQVTVYIPDDLERDLRLHARRAGKSLSSVVTELARARLRPAVWPDGFKELFGSWEGAFPEPEDPPPDEVTLAVHEGQPRRRRRR